MTSIKNFKGKISFINYDKSFLVIEYEDGKKKKTINGPFSLTPEAVFKVGDTVSFTTSLNPRGDRLQAENINFLYNEDLDMLLNKAKTQNRFSGYLKKADGRYFVKEINTFLFIPLPISKWQIPPTEKEINEEVEFYLENTEKKDKAYASLFSNKYIPGFHEAVKNFKNKSIINGEIDRVSEHAIYVNVAEGIQAKIGIIENNFSEGNEANKLKAGDIVPVKIIYLNKNKIIAEMVMDNKV